MYIRRLQFCIFHPSPLVCIFTQPPLLSFPTASAFGKHPSPFLCRCHIIFFGLPKQGTELIDLRQLWVRGREFMGFEAIFQWFYSLWEELAKLDQRRLRRIGQPLDLRCSVAAARVESDFGWHWWARYFLFGLVWLGLAKISLVLICFPVSLFIHRISAVLQLNLKAH